MEELVVEKEPAPKKKSKFFQKTKRRLLRHLWLVRIGILILVFLAGYFLFSLLGSLFARTGLENYLKTLSNFIWDSPAKIETAEGRTNILILGKAGEGYGAKDLTDTIIFASISYPKSKLSLISLPRDIWIPAIRAKVNSAYYWGNQRKEKGGLILAKSTIEEIVGQPIHYAVVIDFSGFTKIVDVIGGIEVNVEREFIDEKYPVSGKENDLCDGDPLLGCRYQTVKFEKGLQTMDGETALKFVRSRNAEGEEGSDLARASRQQKVILAIKQKILSRSVLFSPKRISAILKVIRESVETDIESQTGAVLARWILEAKDDVFTHVLAEDLLIHPPVSPRYDNQYVFIPKAGDWSNIHQWVSQRLP